jgi:hypothetical protein
MSEFRPPSASGTSYTSGSGSLITSGSAAPVSYWARRDLTNIHREITASAESSTLSDSTLQGMAIDLVLAIMAVFKNVSARKVQFAFVVVQDGASPSNHPHRQARALSTGRSGSRASTAAGTTPNEHNNRRVIPGSDAWHAIRNSGHWRSSSWSKSFYGRPSEPP